MIPPPVHMPVTECRSLWDSTCLQGTTESWILDIVAKAKTPEGGYLGYTCLPDSNASLASIEQHRMDSAKLTENF